APADRGGSGAEASDGSRAAAARRPALSDSALLAEAATRAALLPRLKGVLVSQDGRIVLDRTFRGSGPGARTNVKSVSKTILATLVGIAIERGELQGEEQTVASVLPEHFGPGTDPRKRSITLGHLLSMTSGLETTSFQNYGAWVSSRNWVRAALEQPLVAEPGTEMIYSTGSTHVLSAVLTRATGVSTLEYANRHLGEPLGIRIRPWQRDPQGIYFGGNDMYLSPRDLLRFGELFLNGGMDGDRQVVPRRWIEASFAPRGESGWSGHRYGYGWWMRESGGRRVYFAWGYGGQYVFVVPELELAAVFTSESEGPRAPGHLPAIHALLDEYLVPAAEPGG
ncbi:MAG TPA: serine hydrolase, partial [Longimicrobiaceae bacterium]|nr:serine hydrolase [Longimicrobiaceae bacterium]